MAKLGPLVRVRAVELLGGYKVKVEFEDGVRKEMDLEPYLRGPIFVLIRDDLAMFRLMQVQEGPIAWNNGADIDPDALYNDELKPAWMEERERIQ